MFSQKLINSFCCYLNRNDVNEEVVDSILRLIIPIIEKLG